MNCELLYWRNCEDLFRLVQLLQKENIVVGTSDTVLGLLAVVSPYTFKRLNFIKRRKDQPYIILIPSIDHINHYIKNKISQAVKNMLEHCWPGPLTVIFPALDSLPPYIRSHKKSIALRVPNHQGLQHIMNILGPLFSTSANMTGKPVPSTIEDIDSKIKNEVAACIDGQEQLSVQPSTIVDCTEMKPRIVREGILSSEYLKSFW